MKSINIILILVAMAILIPQSSAVINVTYANVGTTYINWSWNAGLNVTDIFLDGVQQCGYETTNSSIIQTGLDPNSLHTIVVVTSIDIGSNSTTTLPEDELPLDSDHSGIVFGLIGGLIGSVLIYNKTRDEK